MSHIILDDEQARIMTESQGPVELRDRDGNLLAKARLDVSAEEIAIAKQRLRSDEPRYTTREVLDHLQSVEQG